MTPGLCEGSGDLNLRYPAIDGLRAWLAWAVVIGHVVAFSGLDRVSKIFAAAGEIPGVAVSAFICISGFVIANLILNRDEPYLPYIIRRAFRIFPLYLVVLPLGVATSALATAIAPHVGWSQQPGYEYLAELLAARESELHYFWSHLLLHVSLLQGLAPDTLLPFSERVFIAPAWSLSLEWQFYLIAPFWIGLLRNRSTVALGVAVGVLGLVVYDFALADHYRLPSVLPGKSLYFLLGIGCRLLAPWISGRLQQPVAIGLGLVALTLVAPHAGPYALWLVFICYLFADRARVSKLEGLGLSLADKLFASKPAMAAGERSYAVYIAHWPALQVASFLVMKSMHPGQAPAVLLVLGLTTVMTLAAAEVLHRLVEKPMIRVGSRLANAARTLRPIPDAPVEQAVKVGAG